MERMDDLPQATVERAVAIVPVRDLERAIAFYERLGFVGERYEGGGYAFVRRDEVQLHLREAAGELTGHGSVCGIYLYMSDADDVYEAWSQAGVEILGEPEDKVWGMREFALTDPDGTLLRVGHRLPG